MKYRLNEVIGQIGFAAEQVTVGSRQIADSTIALSQGLQSKQVLLKN